MAAPIADTRTLAVPSGGSWPGRSPRIPSAGPKPSIAQPIAHAEELAEPGGARSSRTCPLLVVRGVQPLNTSAENYA